MSAHVHAANMALYAQDAAETDKPWERWEYKSQGLPWQNDMNCHPVWHPEVEYRRKPKTIRIGKFDIPEPMREAPARYTKFWTPRIDPWGSSKADEWLWTSHEGDFVRLKAGICHLSIDGALQHGRALRSITEVE